MAQYDTGLGWSAEDNYLVQTSGATIASLSTPPHWTISGYETQVIPVTAQTSADVVAGGLLALEFVQNIAAYKWYYAANKEGALVSYFFDAIGFIKIIIIVPDDSYRVYFQRTENGSIQGGVAVTSTYSTITIGTDIVHYNYSTWSGVSPDSGYQLHIPAFPNQSTAQACVQTAWANIAPGSEALFTKDNPGYTVACLVKWKTTNGTELISPILISSDTEFVDMTSSGSFNLAKFNKLLSGVRFYMAFWDIPGSNALSSMFPEIDLTSRGNIDLEQLFMIIISTNYSHITIINSPDPYEQEGADSGEEGGDGEDTGDDDAGIEAGSDFPSAINTGFCRIFSPSESELRDLSNYLWSNSYDIAQVKKLFSNPMDSILGLSAVPIRLLGSSVSFSLGGVPITGMTLPMVTQQRYTYHMGSITIKERWGSYLDYDPYTKFSIFLPFIGMREMAADDIMGKTVSLVYDIDILTGMCTARLQAGTNCLYEWGGNCAIQMPVNSRNWDSVFSTAVSAVGGIVSAVTGGSAPLVAGSVASAALQTVSMKPRIDKSSTIGGAAGWLGQMTPYIIRTTPEAFIPTDQNKFIGYPAYINVALDAISGYNEVESIHLENVTATGAELEEIESILKGGVIF